MKHEKTIYTTTFSVKDNNAKVCMPIRENLSINSTINALLRFKDWELLNVLVVYAEQGCTVDFLFQKTN